jgi:ribosomal protein S18 acetylase RimI-like enzyme
MIRRATADDIGDLTRLIAEFRDWWGKSEPPGAQIRTTLEALMADPSSEYLLAFDGDGTAVGVCQLRYRLSVWTGAEDCWLEDLFVSERARGGGHGRELVERAFESARARGCKRIELDVNEQNEAALRFYESLGFTTEPKPPGRTLFVSRRL